MHGVAGGDGEEQGELGGGGDSPNLGPADPLLSVVFWKDVEMCTSEAHFPDVPDFKCLIQNTVPDAVSLLCSSISDVLIV